MKKNIFLVFLVCITFSSSSAFATEVKLTLQSYPSTTLPTVSTVIDIPDINDQLEISRQAGLFSLAPEGWNLESLDGWLQYRDPSVGWIGHLYFVDTTVPVPIPQDLINLFGYNLTETDGANGAGYLLYFHTDEWVERSIHNIGESLNNYGVIGGGMDGNAWHQCPVPNWGRFYITELLNIDIKPGDATNTINLKKTKTVPIAILSTPSFSAPLDVDKSALTFGATGMENSLISCADRKPKDVNGDGLPDLVCQFSTNLTNLPCGNTVGVLKGQKKVTTGNLFEGRFEGSEGINLMGCK